MSSTLLSNRFAQHYTGEPTVPQPTLFRGLNNNDSHTVLFTREQDLTAYATEIRTDRELNTSNLLDQKLKSVLDEIRLDVPILDLKAATYNQYEDTLPVSPEFRGMGASTFIGSVMEMTIPFTGNPDLFDVRPSQFGIYPTGEIIDGTLICIYDSPQGVVESQDAMERKALNKAHNVQEYLNQLRVDFDGFNDKAERLLREAVDHRKGFSS